MNLLAIYCIEAALCYALPWGTHLISTHLLSYAGKKKAKCERINSPENVNNLHAARTVAEALKKSRCSQVSLTF